MDVSASKTQDDSNSVPAEVEGSKRQEKEVQQEEAKMKEKEHMEGNISDQVARSKEQESTIEKDSTENRAKLSESSQSSCASCTPTKSDTKVPSEARKKIFISFSFTVKKEVTKLKDEIEQEIGKDTCWICTSEVRGGDILDKEITKAINNADIILCMINKGFVDSEECLKEVLLGRNKCLIPILLEEVKWPLETSKGEPSTMQLSFANRFYINLYDKEKNHDEFGKLIKAIKEKLQLQDIQTSDPLPLTSIPTPTSVPHGYRQFLIQLESILTDEHAHKLANSFGYAEDKIEDISKSETPCRLLVRLMDESGEISPTDISKLTTALKEETGLKDVTDEVKETFELYGEFYEKFLHTLESKLTGQDAVSLAENFGYRNAKIDNIRRSETPSQVFVQLMCEENDISPTNNSKLQNSLKERFGKLGNIQFATEVDKAFELQRKTTQFVKELKGKYQNLCGGILPVPFLREKYDIDKVFVESGIQFRLDKQGNDEEKKKWKEIDNHKKIFTDSQVKSNRRIIDGEPGYGKSSLALQITHDWCQRKEPMEDFSILILLRLSQFRNVSNVYAAIKKFLVPRSTELDTDDIKKILDSSSAVFILDGYDEYPGRGNEESDIECIIKGDMFQKHQVVLLTRTSCPPLDTTSDTKWIRLTGFNDALRFEYILNVVTSRNSVKANEINQLIEKSPVAANFCMVPMFCVMICHMAKDKESFKDLETVTTVFKRVVECFHSHDQIRSEPSTKQRKAKQNHSKLDMIAFEALRKTSQGITWDKNELRGKIGEDLYDEYVGIGILREEEVFDNDECYFKTETRFFHKLFVEWYAAHYLATEITQSSTRSESRHNTKEEAQGTSQQQDANRKGENLFRILDQPDLHYTFRFACGLNREAALEIIKYLDTNKYMDKYTVLCIAEWMAKWNGSLDTIEDTITALCSRGLHITRKDSLVLQRCTVKIIEFAFRRKIPIRDLRIGFIPDKDDSGNLILKPSNLLLPVTDTNSQLSIMINPYDHEITGEQMESILQYLAKCRGSIKLRFKFCLLPGSIEVTESMSALTSRDVEIFWSFIPDGQFRLNFTSGEWEKEKDGKPITDKEYQEKEKKFYMEQQARTWPSEMQVID